MILRLLLAGLTAAGIACSGRAQQRPPGEPSALVRLVRQADGEVDPAPLSFAVHRGRVDLDGVCVFDPVGRQVRLSGTFRTTQALDPAARLSYQVYDQDNRLLQLDGRRLAWTGTKGPVHLARFEVVYGLPHRRHPVEAVSVQFNYVVENRFWYRDHDPGLFLPVVRVENLPRMTYFRVRWSFLPRILPAGTLCRFPARVEAIYRDDGPVPFVGSLDAKAGDGARIDGPRIPLPATDRDRDVFWQLQQLTTPAPGTISLRPGFVWEDVRWYDRYRDNPYRKVLIVGPLAYAIGASLLACGFWFLAAAAGRSRSRLTRWVVRLLVAVPAGYLVAVLCLASYALPIGLAGLMFWLARRRLDAGIHAYGTSLVHVAALELYWSWVDAAFPVLPSATVFSISVAALVLLPLCLVRGPRLAAALVAGITLLATVASIAMSIYFEFFKDFPSVSALLYASQVDDLQDSIASLGGQAQLVPLWFWLAVPVSLWIRLSRATRPGPEFRARQETLSPAAP